MNIPNLYMQVVLVNVQSSIWFTNGWIITKYEHLNPVAYDISVNCFGFLNMALYHNVISHILFFMSNCVTSFSCEEILINLLIWINPCTQNVSLIDMGQHSNMISVHQKHKIEVVSILTKVFYLWCHESWEILNSVYVIQISNT